MGKKEEGMKTPKISYPFGSAHDTHEGSVMGKKEEGKRNENT